MIDKNASLRGVYAITDPALCPEHRLLDMVEAALKGGARLIQYRDKPATPQQRVSRASALKALCDQYGALLIINDDLELCLQVHAHGLHLGRSDGDVAAARNALGPERVLGVTCHSDLAYALDAKKLGADYCAFGRLFDSNTKPEAPPCPLEVLVQARQLGLCTVAIGGINVDNAGLVWRSGADMIAVIHGIFGQPDIENSVRRLIASSSDSSTSAR